MTFYLHLHQDYNKQAFSFLTLECILYLQLTNLPKLNLGKLHVSSTSEKNLKVRLCFFAWFGFHPIILFRYGLFFKGKPVFIVFLKLSPVFRNSSMESQAISLHCSLLSVLTILDFHHLVFSTPLQSPECYLTCLQRFFYLY